MRNKKKYTLSASIICADFMNLKANVGELERAGIDSIHFDVMDGLFVPRYGLFPEIITQIRSFSRLPIEAHMMVRNSENYLRLFINSGLNQPNDVFIVHTEATYQLKKILRKIRAYGIKAGVAVNPSTPLEVLDPIIREVDTVLLMAIKPGIVGHPLIEGTFDRITDLREKIPSDIRTTIAIDGGVSFTSAFQMMTAGSDSLVCGSQTVFNSRDTIIANTTKLRAILENTAHK